MNAFKTSALTALCLALAGGTLSAQDYTNNFSAIKVDRGKGPATLHGGFTVDPASGALSVDIPLGPGIGNSRLHFTPALRSRWSPQWGEAAAVLSEPLNQMQIDMVTISAGGPPPPNSDLHYGNRSISQSAGGFDGWFGGFQLELDSPPDTALNSQALFTYGPPSMPEDSIAQLQLPEGSRQSIVIDANHFQPAGTLPTATQVAGLLQRFGYDPGVWKLAPDPGQGVPTFNADGSAQYPYVYMDDAGDLVVGIYSAGSSLMRLPSSVLPSTAITAAAPTASTGSDGSNFFILPPKVLVIRGDLLVEYDLSGGYYSGPIQVLLDPTVDAENSVSRPNALCFCLGANYQPVRMTNPFGDAIQFSYGATPTATWVPAEGGSGANISFGSTVQYQGGAQNPAFKILDGVGSLPGVVGFDSILKPILSSDWCPGGVENLATGEQVTFTYQNYAAPTPPNGYADPTAETVLTHATMDGRTLDFNWYQYPYRYGIDDSQVMGVAADANGNLTSNTTLPHYAMGLGSLVETDTKSNTARTEAHTRVIPAPNLTLSSGAAYWNDTTFYDGIVHPDGRITVNVYVEPAPRTVGVTPAGDGTAAFAMQARAYGKHQIREVREYAAPSGSQDPLYWQTDLTATKNSPASSLAYRITEYDRWDFHGDANPTGVYGLTAVPHPTRTRVWDANNQILTVTETTGWDSADRGYTTTTEWTCTSSASLAGTDYLAVDYPGSGTTLSAPTGQVRETQTVRQLSSIQAQWLFDRMLVETPTVLSDTTAGLAAGQTFPYAEPPITRAYNSDAFDQVHSITHGWVGGSSTTTTFGYGTGNTQGQLLSASVTGQDAAGAMVNSGKVGASYGYDLNGFMNLIKPSGVAWSYQQSQDGLGLAQTQTDPNGIATGFQWDGGGRLTAITPPSPEVGTQVQIESDNLGFIVTHGAQAARYRFNAFGELALEQRSLDGGASWSSHKTYGYDPGGRKTGETIWLSGAGDETEWAKPNLTQTATVTTVTSPGFWDSEPTVTGKPVTFWVPPVTQTNSVPTLYAGSFWAYDSQGRPVQTIDPNGITTTTSYGVRSKSVAVGAGTGAVTTTFTLDELGRLVQITDPKNQLTQYAYDPAGRISQVVQQDPATGAQQVRSWSYDSLGRLTSLTQPESGTTSYSAFTVTGKPTVTVYGSTSSTPRTLTGTLDALDRMTAATAADGSVNETLTYDETGHGAGNGRLTSASMNGVNRTLTYSGLNGRLSGMTRSLDGQSFSLGLGYDTYGNVSSRTYPDGKVESLPFDLARGVPNGASLNGANLASLAFDPVHWGLTGLTYANGGNSFFSYDKDQARLLTMSHLAGSQQLASWSFQYDSRGNLLGDGEDVYSYDELDRLLLSYMRDPQDVVAGHGLRQALNYDAFGNRSLLTTQRVTNWTNASSLTAPAISALGSDPRTLDSYAMSSGETSAMAATNHLPSTTGGVATGAGYDAQGNLTSLYATPGNASSQLTMVYDALGRVTMLSNAATGTTEKYSYDDEGLRSMVEIWQNGELQSKRYMIYNESRQLMAEYDLVLR